MRAKSGEFHIDFSAWDLLREIQPPDDPEFFSRFLGLFISTSDQLLSDLLSIDIGDKKKLTDLAHSWKSSSYGMGARQLGDLCSRLEKFDDNELTTAELIEAIQEEYLYVRTELETFRKSA